MLDRRISIFDASPADADFLPEAVQQLLARLNDFAVAENEIVATQQHFSPLTPQSLATRYAIANSITRRRCHAILREAETSARAGVALIAGREGRHAASTVAAARFLGKSIMASLGRIDRLLVPQAV